MKRKAVEDISEQSAKKQKISENAQGSIVRFLNEEPKLPEKYVAIGETSQEEKFTFKDDDNFYKDFFSLLKNGNGNLHVTILYKNISDLELNLYNTYFENKIVKMVIIKTPFLKPEHTKIIAEHLPEIKNVEYLSLSGAMLNQESFDNIIKGITNNKCIKTFVLPKPCKGFISQNHKIPVDLKILEELVLKNSTLDYLDLNKMQLTKEYFIKIMEALKTNKGIKSINLSELNFDDTCFQKIIELIKENNLITSYSLSKTPLNDNNIQPIITALENNYNVTHFDVSNTKISTENFIKIRDIIDRNKEINKAYQSSVPLCEVLSMINLKVSNELKNQKNPEFKDSRSHFEILPIELREKVIQELVSNTEGFRKSLSLIDKMVNSVREMNK